MDKTKELEQNLEEMRTLYDRIALGLPSDLALQLYESAYKITHAISRAADDKKGLIDLMAKQATDYQEKVMELRLVE